MNGGQIELTDRVDLDSVREKLDKAYDEIAKLKYDDVVILAGFLVVVHNHWNWEELLNELKSNNKKGVEDGRNEL